jgi:hypothetical protein
MKGAKIAASAIALSNGVNAFADIFVKSGAQTGMCADLKNIHPLAIDFKAEKLTGKWKTILVDSAMSESGSECLTAEFFTIPNESNLGLKINELSRLVPAQDESSAQSSELKFKTFVSG